MIEASNEPHHTTNDGQKDVSNMASETIHQISCRRCGKVKIHTEFPNKGFKKSGEVKRGRVCLDCQRKRRCGEAPLKPMVTYGSCPLTHKACGRCGTDKQRSEFYRSAREKDGLHVYCKPCVDAMTSAYSKTTRGKEVAKKMRRPYNSLTNEEKQRLNGRRRKAIAEGRYKERILRNRLQKTYGLTIEEFEKMVEVQKGRCAICGCKPKIRGRRGKVFHIDHDHRPGGSVRELLCNDCNAGLGRFQDDAEIILKAYQYLLKHRQLKLVM